MATPSNRASNQAARRRKPRVGITNHPLDEELEQQERVPPPGTARADTEPALLPRPGEHPAPRDPAPKRRRAKYPMPE
jgi:hypothetical protein